MARKIASRKKKIPSRPNAKPNTLPKLAMNCGHSSPISKDRIVPVTTPTANSTSATFDQRLASDLYSASPVRRYSPSTNRNMAGNAIPKHTSGMWTPSESACIWRACSRSGWSAPPGSDPATCCANRIAASGILTRHVDVARPEGGDLAGLRVIGVTPHAPGVVGQQVDRDRRLRRGRAHGMDVVGGRQQGVEVAGLERAPLARRDRLAREDLLVLGAAVEADEPPREVVVDGGPGVRRDDEREQRRRPVAGAEQQPLADAAAHPAVRVSLLVAGGEPAGIGEQLGEGWPDRVAGILRGARVGDMRPHAADELAHDRGVEHVLVVRH